MASLQSLMVSLKANYIVVIENDLQYENKPYTVLAKFCRLSDFQTNRLLTSLINLGKNELAQYFETFKSAYYQLTHNIDLQNSLLPDDFDQYLKEIKKESIVSKEFIDRIGENLNESSVNEIFLRSGIFTLNDIRYDSLFEELSQNSNVEFAYYKARPVPTELDFFSAELLEGIRQTESQYYIAVVDKMLGEGMEESGKSFIEVDLVGLNQKNKLNNLAFLFTSQASPTQPNEYKDFFIREVDKGSEILGQVIAGFLTDTSYATVFKHFEESYVEASQHALSMALKNQQNVKHVIHKSINEGISPFDSLKGWFDQIVQYNMELLQVDKLDYYSSLTKFFDNESLVDHDGIKEYGPDLEKINSFELFDHNVNKKGLPIFPGDIFIKDGEYYILMGQICDLLIRDNGTRGAKIAEFLKFKVVAFSEGEHDKFVIKVDERGKKNVLIQHFLDVTVGSYGVASIDITSKNIYYGFFNVIDLCYYNIDGASKIEMGNLEEYEKVPWVSTSKYQYILKLSEYFRLNKKKLIDDSPVDNFETFVFTPYDLKEDQESLHFGFKRVSRLKGRFYDSLYQQLINYKARIDLNLIDQAVATTTMVKLYVKHSNIEKGEELEVPLNRIKPSKGFVNAKDIVSEISSDFIDAINKNNRYTDGHNSNNYSLKNEGNRYVLELPIHYYDKDNKMKVLVGETIRFSRLFKDGLENRKYQLIGDEKELLLNDNGDISLSQLEQGVLLLQNNIILKLKGGIIQKTKNA